MRGGHLVDQQGCEALRIAQIDATVAALGVFAALDRYEAAEAVARDLAAKAQAKHHEAAARGFLAAAAELRIATRVLVERHG